MKKNKLIILCLFQAQLFETFWAYYLQSNGFLYEEESHNAARNFLDSYEGLCQIDSKYSNPVILKLGENTDISKIINNFNKWINGSDYHYDMLFKVFLACLKNELLKDLDISAKYQFSISSIERFYSPQFIRWDSHIPKDVLYRTNDPDTLVLKASNFKSIALVGDIRRSQDLMTYAKDPVDYSSKMEQFITTTRKLIDIHGGFFDKFTGDGFIVYFNEEICKKVDLDYINCFINFIKDEMNFAIPFFKEWVRSIRKCPIENIGLALGADIGNIEFKNIKNHLIAVGDTIVWATRMASICPGNETLINNLLYSLLEDKENISLKQHKGKTKSGENFLAYKLNIN